MAHIAKRPSGRYQVQIKLNGLRPINRTFSTKKAAVAFARQVEGDSELARKLGAPVVDCPTFQTLADEYMAAVTLRDTRNLVSRLSWWCKRLGELKVTAIDEFKVDDALHDLAKSRTGSTINRYKSTLSAVLRWFIRHRDYKHLNYRNPVRAESVSTFRENPAKDRFLTDDEQRRLLDACRLATWDRMYLLVLMALTTGARKGELLGLRWCDIDFPGRTARLAVTKNGKARLLPLTAPVLAELQRFREVGDALVFHSRIEKDNPAKVAKHKPTDPSKQWRNALKRARLENVRLHDLRHSAASNYARAGRSLFEIGQLLGHSSPAMTQRYSHLCVKDVQAMADAVVGGLS
jgi:integrase